MGKNADEITLAILNITSWSGIDSNATHIYGTLILCQYNNVTIDNVEDYNVRFLGQNIELFRPMDEELARLLDKKDGGSTFYRRFMSNTEYNRTNRFDTFEQVITAATEKYKELNINCSFIILYEGNKLSLTNY